MGFLYHSLREHRIGNFHETANVGAFHVVNMVAVFAVFEAGGVYRFHDSVQTLVHFFARGVV